MKKLFLFLAAAMVSVASMAYTVNNPVGEDGRYIVKYNCETGEFAAANDFEVDEMVTIAFDVTGTWLEEFLKATPTTAGASRGVALNFWCNYGDTNGDVRRLKQMNGNVWGATMKLSQVMVTPELALMTDSVVYFSGQLFGFEFTADKPGAGWWMGLEGDFNGENTWAEGSDCLFATAAYTGTKTTDDVYSSDFVEPIYGFDLAGYGAPCSELGASALEDVKTTNVAQKVIMDGQIILIHNGVRYNVLGAQVK